MAAGPTREAVSCLTLPFFLSVHLLLQPAAPVFVPPLEGAPPVDLT